MGWVTYGMRFTAEKLDYKAWVKKVTCMNKVPAHVSSMDIHCIHSITHKLLTGHITYLYLRVDLSFDFI